MTIFDTTSIKMSGITKTSSIANIIAKRSNIFEMSQIAENAVIFPKVCGAFSHELRAWLAGYISKKANNLELANYFMRIANENATWSNPNCETKIDLQILITFVDKAATKTSDVKEKDITILKLAGLADEDIVRLCQILAFVSFQIRVIKGLELMRKHCDE